MSIGTLSLKKWQPPHRSAQAANDATRYQQWRSGFIRVDA